MEDLEIEGHHKPYDLELLATEKLIHTGSYKGQKANLYVRVFSSETADGFIGPCFYEPLQHLHLCKTLGSVFIKIPKTSEATRPFVTVSVFAFEPSGIVLDRFITPTFQSVLDHVKSLVDAVSFIHSEGFTHSRLHDSASYGLCPVNNLLKISIGSCKRLSEDIGLSRKDKLKDFGHISQFARRLFRSGNADISKIFTRRVVYPTSIGKVARVSDIKFVRTPQFELLNTDGSNLVTLPAYEIEVLDFLNKLRKRDVQNHMVHWGPEKRLGFICALIENISVVDNSYRKDKSVGKVSSPTCEAEVVSPEGSQNSPIDSPAASPQSLSAYKRVTLQQKLNKQSLNLAFNPSSPFYSISQLPLCVTMRLQNENTFTVYYFLRKIRNLLAHSLLCFPHPDAGSIETISQCLNFDSRPSFGLDLCLAIHYPDLLMKLFNFASSDPELKKITYLEKFLKLDFDDVTVPQHVVVGGGEHVGSPTVQAESEHVVVGGGEHVEWPTVHPESDLTDKNDWELNANTDLKRRKNTRGKEN